MYAEANKSFKLAFQTAMQISDVAKQCQAQIKLGSSYKVLQEFDMAERSFQKARKLANENEFKVELAEATAKLAGVLIEKDDHQGASEYINDAMKMSVELRNWKLEMEVRVLSGLVLGS